MADLIQRERKDCSVNITVTSDKTEAYVMVMPPENGGNELTEQIFQSALQRYGIVYGLKDDIIRKIIDEVRYNQKFCIAVATPPENGQDGKIDYRFSKERDTALEEDEFGFVDYKNLKLVRTVYKDDVIADITPPTEGTPGTDVYGKDIRQMPGKKASFTVGKNTRLTEDGLSIVADADGNLVFKNGAFQIETTVTINGDVDSSVGNIDFIGDVVIKGNIFEGFKVSSNTNITVSGEANGATLEAGGNIDIKRGCINSRVTAHGSFKAMFCEHANINCDGDVSAQNFVLCDIYCGGNLNVTSSSAGGIIGGRIIVLNSLNVPEIGSKNYIPTDITLGDNALLSEEKTGLLAKISQHEKSLADLTKIVDFLNEKKKQLHHLPEDKEAILGNAARQKVLLNVEIKTAQKRIQEIDLSLACRQNLTVSCKGHIYPGTRITINDTNFKVENEYVHTVIGLDEDGMVLISPLT